MNFGIACNGLFLDSDWQREIVKPIRHHASQALLLLWGLLCVPRLEAATFGLAAWGAGTNNSGTAQNYNQSVIPAGITNAVKISAGGFHNLAAVTSGRVAAWGYNDRSQTNVVAGLADAWAVAGGYWHSVALRSNGTAAAWGYSAYNQTTVSSSATSLVAVAAGWYHNLAVRTNGTVVAWGAGTSITAAPILGQSIVPSGLTNVIAVAAGGYHSLALKRDGTVVAWGAGTNTSGTSFNKGQSIVPTDLSNVVAIAAGASNSLALKSDGTVVGWGDNSYGQTNVPPGLSNVVGIACGGSTCAALKGDGALVLWGDNTYGQAAIPEGKTNIVAVSLGVAHTLILTNNGEPSIYRTTAPQSIYSGEMARFEATVISSIPVTYQWLCHETNIANATNSVLTIPDAQPSDSGIYRLMVTSALETNISSVMPLAVFTSPPLVLKQPANVTTFAGNPISFAPSIAGSLPMTYQWTFNGANLPGATNATLSFFAYPFNAGTYSLLLSNSFGTNMTTSAALMVKEVAAWGAGTNNTGTPPKNGQSIVPANVTDVIAVAGGVYHSLALHSDGTVTPWGRSQYGEATIQPTATNLVAISAGLNHSIGLRSDGTAMVWGNNTYGQNVMPPWATNLIAIAAGWNNNLALRRDGRVSAWGNSTGIYFEGGPDDLSNIVAIAAGAFLGAALRNDGTVTCWEYYTNKSLTYYRPPADLDHVIAIAAGGSNCLALKADGTVVGWGKIPALTNVPPGLSNVARISCGIDHALAVKRDGTVVMWGSNTNGQTDLPAGLANVAAIAAGGYHTIAALNTGPITFLQHPRSLMIYDGEALEFSVAALGASPIHYQWQINGGDIPGATNAAYSLSTAGLTNSGDYQLILVNDFGAVTSSIAKAQVLPWAPQISSPSSDALIAVSSNMNLVATAYGLPPLTYLWNLNGATVATTTNGMVTITNIQFGMEGLYEVVVTNLYGKATGQVAVLTAVDIARAVNATNLTFINAGQTNWYVQMTETHDRKAAISSPHSTRTVKLQTTVTGPGTLTFWWQSLGSEAVFSIDGAKVYSLVLVAWQSKNIHIPAGSHLLEWSVVADFKGSEVDLDEITFTPDVALTGIQVGPGGAALQLNGFSGHGNIIIYGSTNLVNWQPIFTNPPDMGPLDYLDLAAPNQPARFYRAAEE